MDLVVLLGGIYVLGRYVAQPGRLPDPMEPPVESEREAALRERMGRYGENIYHQQYFERGADAYSLAGELATQRLQRDNALYRKSKNVEQRFKHGMPDSFAIFPVDEIWKHREKTSCGGKGVSYSGVMSAVLPVIEKGLPIGAESNPTPMEQFHTMDEQRTYVEQALSTNKGGINPFQQRPDSPDIEGSMRIIPKTSEELYPNARTNTDVLSFDMAPASAPHAGTTLDPLITQERKRPNVLNEMDEFERSFGHFLVAPAEATQPLRPQEIVHKNRRSKTDLATRMANMVGPNISADIQTEMRKTRKGDPLEGSDRRAPYYLPDAATDMTWSRAAPRASARNSARREDRNMALPRGKSGDGMTYYGGTIYESDPRNWAYATHRKEMLGVLETRQVNPDTAAYAPSGVARAVMDAGMRLSKAPTVKEVLSSKMENAGTLANIVLSGDFGDTRNGRADLVPARNNFKASTLVTVDPIADPFKAQSAVLTNNPALVAGRVARASKQQIDTSRDLVSSVDIGGGNPMAAVERKAKRALVRGEQKFAADSAAFGDTREAATSQQSGRKPRRKRLGRTYEETIMAQTAAFAS